MVAGPRDVAPAAHLGHILRHSGSPPRTLSSSSHRRPLVRKNPWPARTSVLAARALKHAQRPITLESHG